MIKRLIFDLDNTLITWEDTYYEFAVKNVCKDLHLANYSEILNIVITSIDNYEKNYEYFSIKNMVTLLNKNANISNYSHIIFDKIFVQKLIYYFTFCIPNKADPSVSETLKYLSKKYDLVILTNWFEKPQITRLKKLDILQYFSHVYGTEKIKNKPNKEAFITAIGDFKSSECVMIGDNINTDIQGALNCNINAIFYNKKNINLSDNTNILQQILKQNSNNIKCITSLTELKEIL